MTKELSELTAIRDRDKAVLTKLQEAWYRDKEEKLALQEEAAQRAVETGARKKLHLAMVFVHASVRFSLHVFKKRKEESKKSKKKSKKKKKKG